MKRTAHILLNFDLEEFDIPLEYGTHIIVEEQMRIGLLGLEAILPLLAKYNICATFFTTVSFASKFPEVVKRISEKHEIASHALSHTGFDNSDYKKSKEILEKITGYPVYGFRMPRFAGVDIELLKEAGYSYDSSIHPTWIPGRYNSRHIFTDIYTEDDLLRIPCSVSPDFLRFPLFWLSFKNFPLVFYQFLLNKTLNKNKFACLYFHPWEFADISKYEIPNYTKKICGAELVSRLEKFISGNLNSGYEFLTIHDYLIMKKYLN